jgi:hypothetical protein
VLAKKLFVQKIRQVSFPLRLMLPIRGNWFLSLPGRGAARPAAFFIYFPITLPKSFSGSAEVKFVPI